MGVFEKFKALPSKRKFHGSLMGKKISDKEYEHVLQVQGKSKVKTMKDYYNLHLKFNVLQLANVF